jgi:hypothetical protein
MDRELVKVLARRVVAQQAPGEQEAFDSLADYYLDNPKRAKTAARGDAPLGSGLATTVEFLTPPAIYVCQRALDLTTEEALKDVARRVKRKLPWPRKRVSPPPVHGGEVAASAASEPGTAADTATDIDTDTATATGSDTDEALARARELLRGREAEVHDTALAAGIEFGLPRKLAKAVADVFVDQLFGESAAAEPIDQAGVAADPAVSPKPESADTPTDPLPQSAD